MSMLRIKQLDHAVDAVVSFMIVDAPLFRQAFSRIDHVCLGRPEGRIWCGWTGWWRALYVRMAVLAGDAGLWSQRMGHQGHDHFC